MNKTKFNWQPMETFPKEYINNNNKEVLLKTYSGIVSAWACIEEPTNRANDDGCYEWICYDDMFTMDFDDVTIEGWCEINKDESTKPHWTDRHITIGFIAWDETGANQIGYYETRQDAKQALIDYAKTLDKGEDSNE